MPLMTRKEPVSSCLFKCPGTGTQGGFASVTAEAYTAQFKHDYDDYLSEADIKELEWLKSQQTCSVCLKHSRQCKVMEHAVSPGNEGYIVDRDLLQKLHM